MNGAAGEKGAATGFSLAELMANTVFRPFRSMTRSVDPVLARLLFGLAGNAMKKWAGQRGKQ